MDDIWRLPKPNHGCSNADTWINRGIFSGEHRHGCRARACRYTAGQSQPRRPPGGNRLSRLRREPTKGRADRRHPVLYVHGFTFPSDLSVFWKFDGSSWADALNEAGYSVWAFDFAGLGGSERYPEMNDETARPGPPAWRGQRRCRTDRPCRDLHIGAVQGNSRVYRCAFKGYDPGRNFHDAASRAGGPAGFLWSSRTATARDPAGWVALLNIRAAAVAFGDHQESARPLRRGGAGRA